MRAAGIPLAVILLFACVGAFSQPPGYYNGTENLTGTALKSALNGGYCQKGSGDMRMLDISTLLPGIYVLHIVTDQDRTIHKKIFVM